MTANPRAERLTSGNTAAVKMFAAKDEGELASVSPGGLSPERQPDGRTSRDSILEINEKVMLEGTCFFEWTFRRFDGVEFPATVLLTRMELDGETFLQGTVRDITVQKRAEEMKEQYAIALEGQRKAMEELYEAAEAAARAKSEFLANMSHEIRTPMTAILGYADLLAGQVDDPALRESVEIIRRNGNHLLTIINDILDFSKIEAGKLDVERMSCSPSAIAAEIVSLLRVRAEGKGIGLKLNLASPVPESISTDPARLRQILINLVGNAIKFTETGEVRVVVSLAGREEPKPKLVYEVIDTWHWHDRRASRQPLPAVPAGRHLHGPPLWRHRAGPGDQQAAGGIPGRRHCRPQPARPRQYVQLDHRHRPAGGRQLC